MNFLKPLVARRLTIVGLCLFTCCVYGQDLKAHQWQERVLIIQTSDTRSTAYQEQLAVLKGQATALAERKIVLYKVIGNTYQKIAFPDTTIATKGTLNGALQKLVNKNQAPFLITLIGLDGGKKRQQTTILTVTDLYRLIDGMPMRRYEIKNKG